jgi:cobyric acid synthase
MEGSRPTLVVGRVSDVGPTYVVVGVTRIELREGEEPTNFQLGHSVSVIADSVEDRLVGGSLVG